MEQETPFAPNALDVARDRLTALFDAYRSYTGFSPTFVGKLAVNGDPKFAKSYPSANFSFGTYDTVVSRFSAIWPADLPWPESVPRQAPATIDPETLADLHARLARVGKAPKPQQEDAANG